MNKLIEEHDAIHTEFSNKLYKTQQLLQDKDKDEINDQLIYLTKLITNKANAFLNLQPHVSAINPTLVSIKIQPFQIVDDQYYQELVKNEKNFNPQKQKMLEAIEQMKKCEHELQRQQTVQVQTSLQYDVLQTEYGKKQDRVLNLECQLKQLNNKAQSDTLQLTQQIQILQQKIQEHIQKYNDQNQLIHQLQNNNNKQITQLNDESNHKIELYNRKVGVFLQENVLLKQQLQNTLNDYKNSVILQQQAENNLLNIQTQYREQKQIIQQLQQKLNEYNDLNEIIQQNRQKMENKQIFQNFSSINILKSNSDTQQNRQSIDGLFDIVDIQQQFEQQYQTIAEKENVIDKLRNEIGNLKQQSNNQQIQIKNINNEIKMKEKPDVENKEVINQFLCDSITSKDTMIKLQQKTIHELNQKIKQYEEQIVYLNTQLSSSKLAVNQFNISQKNGRPVKTRYVNQRQWNLK